MKTDKKRVVYVMLLFLSFVSVSAEKKSMAILKAQYNAWHNLFDKNRDNPFRKEDKFIST